MEKWIGFNGVRDDWLLIHLNNSAKDGILNFAAIALSPFLSPLQATQIFRL